MPTFGELIERNGRYWGRKEAFIDEHRRVNWAEFNMRTDALGHALRRRGVAPGDRVVILASDCVELAETFGACMKVGAVRVGLNPRLAAPEVAALVADCAPAMISVHAKSAELLSGLSDLRPRSRWQAGSDH